MRSADCSRGEQAAAAEGQVPPHSQSEGIGQGAEQQDQNQTEESAGKVSQSYILQELQWSSSGADQFYNYYSRASLTLSVLPACGL